jgi:DNA primase
MTTLTEHLNTLQLTEHWEGYLYGRGFSDELISAIKPVTWRSYGNVDISEGDLIYPLWSPAGNLTGITSRPLSGDKSAIRKIVLMKHNPVMLGNANFLQKLWGGSDLFVVEGPEDLAALDWSVGKDHAIIATLTAKMSNAVLDFIERFAIGHVYLVLDNDEPGRTAIYGGVDKDTGKKRPGLVHRLAKRGVAHTVAPYPYKDPGEVWDKGGAALIRRVFQF